MFIIGALTILMGKIGFLTAHSLLIRGLPLATGNWLEYI